MKKIEGETIPVSEGEDVLEFTSKIEAEEWIKEHSNYFY